MVNAFRISLSETKYLSGSPGLLLARTESIAPAGKDSGALMLKTVLRKRIPVAKLRETVKVAKAYLGNKTNSDR